MTRAIIGMTISTRVFLMRMLVVDSDQEQAQITESKFARSGYQIDVVFSAKDAEDLINKNSYGAIIADYRTCQKESSLLQKVRILDPENPKFAITSNQAEVSIDEMMDLGACAVYTKPYSHSRIINELSRLVKPRTTRWSFPKGNRSARPTGIFEVRMESYEVGILNQRFALGHGGIFIQLGQGDFPSEGDIIRLALNFSNGEIKRIEGVGIVRWVRTNSVHDLPAGCGIEFLEVPARFRDQLHDLISACNSSSFIPRKA